MGVASTDFFDLEFLASQLSGLGSVERPLVSRFEGWVQGTLGTTVNSIVDPDSNIVSISGTTSAYCPANHTVVSWSTREPARNPVTNNPQGLQYSAYTADLTPNRIVTLSGVRASNGREFVYTRPNPTAQFSLSEEVAWIPQVRVDCEELPSRTSVSARDAPVPTKFSMSGSGFATCPSGSTFSHGQVVVPIANKRGLSYEEFFASGKRVENSFFARSGVKTLWARDNFFQPFKMVYQGSWTPTVTVTCSR
jgi:hypothetical protein